MEWFLMCLALTYCKYCIKIMLIQELYKHLELAAAVEVSISKPNLFSE